MPQFPARWHVGVRVLLAAALALLALGPLDGPTPTVHAFNFTVNTTNDTPDANTSNDLCADATGQCSLRAALQEIGGEGGSHTVTFSIPPGSVIPLSNTLGSLIWYGNNITVTGGGVIIDASGLAAGTDAIDLQGNDNTLSFVTVRNAPRHGILMGDGVGAGGGNRNQLIGITVIGSGGAGVFVPGSDVGKDNVINSAFIGVTDAVSGCAAQNRNQYGVYVQYDANGLEVSGSYISCSLEAGVVITGTSDQPLNALIAENRIGTSGTLDTGNGGDGVLLANGVHDVRVHGNLISGNDQSGVRLTGTDTTLITVTHNLIGLNAFGSAALPNTFNGVVLHNGASLNVIGGPGGDEVRNVISGNGRNGVALVGSGTQVNLIEHNFIGLDATGAFAIGNGLSGIEVNGATGNYLGSSLAGTAQFISGNAWEGIYLVGSTGTWIGQTNFIGVAADFATPVGNGLAGISLNSGNTGSWILPSLVAFNGGAGIEVLFTSTNNLVQPGYVFANGGLPIDLGRDGHTPNDPGDADTGPNDLLNYPVITATTGSVITGTVCANCEVSIYAAIGDPSKPGGGGDWLDSVTADAGGVWSYTLPAGLTRFDISLLACQGMCGFTGQTSELSPRPWLVMPLIKR